MLNSYEIITQAKDKSSKNLQWIERETELKAVMHPGSPRKQRHADRMLRRAMEIFKSLPLLKWPALSHKKGL
jgi:hypothetical protein